MPISRAASPISASPSAATRRCARRCIRCSCSTPSRRAWTWASSMPASSRSIRIFRRRLREGIEDVLFNRRADATERLLELAQEYKGGGRAGEGGRRCLAQPAGERAHRPRHGAGHRRLSSWKTPRKRAWPRTRPLDVIEGPLMDGHECGGRPVRLGQDVPAPGGQVRPRDEEGGGVSAALHGRRQEPGEGSRRQDHHGHGEGRCA